MTQDDKSRSRASKFVLHEVYHDIKFLSLGGLAMCVSSYSNQMVPKVIGRLIDQSSSRECVANQKSIFIDVISVGLVGALASFLRTSILGHVHESITLRLRERAFENLMINGTDAEEFQREADPSETNKSEDGKEDEGTEPKRRTTPAIISLVLKEDIDSIANTVTNTSASLIRSLSSCVFATTNMLLLNANLVALTVLTAPVVGSLALLTRKKMKGIVSQQQDALFDDAAFVEERIEHIELIQLSSRGDSEVKKYRERQERIARLGQKAALANGFSMGTMFFTSTGALCGILYQGGLAVKQASMNHGDLVSFGTYAFLLALGSAGIVRGMSDFSRGLDSAERLLSLIDPKQSKAVPEPILQEPAIDIEAAEVEKLSLENISFAYAKRPSNMVLNKVSFSLPRGKVVFLTGKNGSGKSTLSKILAGLYKPASGKIRLHTTRSEHDFVNSFDLESKTKLLQLMTQSPALLNETILENVRYSMPEASEEEVKQALLAANFDGRELDYVVGRNGANLSGGQKQRLCLARALLRTPLFLILDEPTSALDNDGQSAVSDAIKACRASNTSLLVISHSQDTLELADHVIVLENGSVVESGSLSELKAKNGSLCSLMPNLL